MSSPNQPDFYPSTRPELPQELIEAVVATRDFTNRENFIGDGLTRWHGASIRAPFSVAVTTFNQKDILGVGIMLGGLIEEDDEAMPVIQIQDTTVSSGFIQFLGSECFWLPSDKGISKELASDSAGKIIVPASHYAVWLDQPEAYESLRT